MKLINRSPYDTRHLRRTVVATARSFGVVARQSNAPWWKTLKVYVVLTGAKVPKMNWGPRFGQIYIRVPKLTGDEWHQIARNETNGHALTTARLASLAYAELSFNKTTSWRVAERFLRKLPAVVPLRVAKPATPERDVVRERYERVIELEKSWMRKQKLASTKVKFYRKRKAYYEKRLAARKEEA